ncbi:hypothetical protein IAU60_004127 [Kwoniella sp. DSM 27419]
MSIDKPGKEAWTEQHTVSLIRSLVASTLIHRSEHYSNAALQGVSDNGGNRINMKLLQILKKLCATYPGADGIVETEIDRLKDSRSGNGSPKKKRKVKDED